jgi:hypothetical protein
LYSVREDCARDLPGTLKSLSEIGYKGVEFAGYHGHSADELKKLLKSTDLKVVGTHININSLLGDELNRTIQFNKIIPISTRSGFVLYQGNNMMAKGDSGGWWPVGKEYIIPKEVSPMTEIERNSYLGKKAKNFIFNYPGAFLNLFIKKIVNMWRPYYSGTSNLSKLVMLLSYIPVILLGLTGILWSYKKWRKTAILVSFILYYVFVHAILVSTIRYRWPVMPCFFIFSALAINIIIQKFKVDS